SSFFFTHPATTDIYTLSLHDALPISQTLQHVARHFAAQLDEMPFPLERQRALAARRRQGSLMGDARSVEGDVDDEDPRLAGACRSEEHTSELQSLAYLVCRLLLEKKK